MNNAFLQYVFSGLSFRAYAARFELSLPKLLRALTGLCDLPSELADPLGVRSALRDDAREILFVAMKGPRGTVRWHQWTVASDVGLAIVNREDEFSSVQEEPGQLYVFPTIDNLVVAINPQCMVTAMIGNEDTGYLVEQRSQVPSLLVSGHQYIPSNQTSVLQEVHDALKQAAEGLSDDAVLVPALFDFLPGYVDARPSRVYLKDLRAPFEDHRWQIAMPTVGLNTLCGALSRWNHLDEEFAVPISVSIVDKNEMRTHLMLPADQTAVVQCSRWAVERCGLERTRVLAVDGAVGQGEGRLTPEMIGNDCRALGLFGEDEVAAYVEQFRETLAKHPDHSTPRRKRRGRPTNAERAQRALAEHGEDDVSES